VVETANDLALKCSAAARDGADFPMVWDTVLEGHALVVGPSIQTFDDEEHPQLEIQSSTVNVSSIFQGPANTLYCGLRAAAYFSPIFSQASCLLKRKAVYLRKRSNTTLRGLMIAGAATQGALKTTQ